MAIELSSIYVSSITLFHDISKQVQLHASIGKISCSLRIKPSGSGDENGKIFAHWHLAIAITSLPVPVHGNSVS